MAIVHPSISFPQFLWEDCTFKSDNFDFLQLNVLKAYKTELMANMKNYKTAFIHISGNLKMKNIDFYKNLQILLLKNSGKYIHLNRRISCIDDNGNPVSKNSLRPTVVQLDIITPNGPLESYIKTNT